MLGRKEVSNRRKGQSCRDGYTNVKTWVQISSTPVPPGVMGCAGDHTTGEGKPEGPQDLTGSQPSYMDEL